MIEIKTGIDCVMLLIEAGQETKLQPHQGNIQIRAKTLRTQR